MRVVLPNWLGQLRQSEITERVLTDPRSTRSPDRETFFGLDRQAALGAIEWGQAQFDEPFRDLSPRDRVLLYSYFNQKGHLEELIAAFTMIFGDELPGEDFVVVDIGCGPFTGGLALAGAMSRATAFDYIGVDQSKEMTSFGEALATAAERFKECPSVRRTWAKDLRSVTWTAPPGWRPVFVVLSYLLASRTVVVSEMLCDLEALLARVGWGPVSVLYTNSTKDGPNRGLPALRRRLERLGFTVVADDKGVVEVWRPTGFLGRPLRYALLHRDRRTHLRLGVQ